MKIYRVYLPKNDATHHFDEAIFIPEGLSIMALLFNALWAIYYRVWGLLLLYLAFSAVFFTLSSMEIISPESVDIFRLGLSVWLGFEAFDWRGKALTKNGYVLYDIVSGKDELDAQRRFLDRAF